MTIKPYQSRVSINATKEAELKVVDTADGPQLVLEQIGGSNFVVIGPATKATVNHLKYAVHQVGIFADE